MWELVYGMNEQLIMDTGLPTLGERNTTSTCRSPAVDKLLTQQQSTICPSRTNY